MGPTGKQRTFFALLAPLRPDVRIKGEDRLVTGISIDTRSLRPGDVFVAVPGSNTHGVEFVSEALEKGASALVVPEEAFEEVSGRCAGVPLVGVRDAREAAGVIASRFHGDSSRDLALIGITGTNGKTTTAFLLEAILADAGLKPGVITTICTGLGGDRCQSSLTTPDPVSLQSTLAGMREKGAKAVVMEVSSHALVQARVAGCWFTLGVFTNLGRDHMDYHRTMEDYFQAKCLLFSRYAPEGAVINTDDPYGRRLWEISKGRKVSYGLGEEAMVRPISYEIGPEGIQAELSTPKGRFSICSSLVGIHNLMNILAAVACAQELGIAREHIVGGIRTLSRVPGRLEAVAAPEGITALVDYAHTPDGLESVLGSLRGLNYSRIITVVGCGGDRDKGKRPQMARVAAELSDIAIFTTDNPRSEDPRVILDQMLYGLEDIPPGHPAGTCSIEVIPDRDTAIRRAASLARPGDCVLVAGKGHETYQLIGGKRIAFDDRMALRQAFEPGGFIRFSEILAATRAEVLSGDTDGTFVRVSTDSRTIGPGDLFFALKGERFDGHDFVDDVLRKGASGVVVSRDLDVPMSEELAPVVLRVEDTLKALGDLASWYRERLGAKVVGITGSCGKTSTKELVAAVLATRWRVSKTKGNFNNLIGLPLSIFEAPVGTQWMVLEMGMNQPGEIRRLCEIARPEVALITNVKPAHLEGLGDIEGVAREKGEIYKTLPGDGVAIVNMDDPYCQRMAASLASRIVGYSLENAEGAEVRCTAWCPWEEGAKLQLVLGTERIGLQIRLLGKAGVQNAVAAAAVGYALGLSPEEIAKGLGAVKPAASRLSLLQLPQGWKIIDDTYNANPGSMKAALETLSQWNTAPHKVAVLGDMLELGERSREFHCELGMSAGEVGLDLLVAVGGFAEAVRDGAVKSGHPLGKILVFANTDELCRWLRSCGFSKVPGPAIVLVKGSRAVGLERCVETLKELIRGGCPMATGPVSQHRDVNPRCVSGGV